MQRGGTHSVTASHDEFRLIAVGAPKLIDQPAFTDSSVGSDADDHWSGSWQFFRGESLARLLNDQIQGRFQSFEFRFPADKAAAVALCQAGFQRLEPQGTPAVHRLLYPLHQFEAQGFKLEYLLHKLFGGIRNHNSAHGRVAFHAGGEIDLRTIDSEISLAGFAHAACTHKAGIDANPYAKFNILIARHLPKIMIVELQLLQHFQAGPNGTFGILFTGFFGPKQGHDGIADIFIHKAAVKGDAAGKYFQKLVHTGMDDLRIETAGEIGEAFDIGKEHRNFTQFSLPKLEFALLGEVVFFQAKKAGAKDHVVCQFGS